MQTPRTEFAQAIKAIAMERNLDPEVILDTIKQAIVAAYKKDAKDRGEDTEAFDYDVVLNPVNGEAKVLAWDHIEPDEEGNVDLSGVEKKDVTPPGFGRIAAQTAKQVIHQKIREAEKGAIMGEYTERVGSIVSGMILRFEGADVRVDLGKTEGIMPSLERVPNERLNLSQRMSFLLKDIVETPRGKQIILSRADPLFVQKLFEREVPEIPSGSVIIKAVARDPGVRTKIAVSSDQSGVDPVGSCVGQRGVRVQSVTNELGGERVDIVMYSDDPAEYIKAALSPAEGLNVKLNKKAKEAIVKAKEDQLSLAIGREGQNARLASRLTDWKIEIEQSGESSKSEEKVEEAETKQKEDEVQEASNQDQAKEKAVNEEKPDSPKDEVPSEDQAVEAENKSETPEATKSDDAKEADTDSNNAAEDSKTAES